jgi:predicted NBD/HSP70 family sugar kinase
MSDPKTVLAVDVGGSHVKILISEGEPERRRFDSGHDLGPQEMVSKSIKLAEGWMYDVVSVGIPAPVRDDRVVTEPVNLGTGWVGFDLQQAFGKPTKVINDAAMQALGSYEGGTMLFLGLGTGLGSALVLGGTVQPLELAHLPYRKETFEDYVGERGRERLGKKKWREAVLDAVARLSAALQVDYVILGGGNAKHMGELPDNVRLGANENAFLGAFRLWES